MKRRLAWLAGIAFLLLALPGCAFEDWLPGGGGTPGTGGIREIRISFLYAGTVELTSAGSRQTLQSWPIGTEIRLSSYALVTYEETTRTLRAFANASSTSVPDLVLTFDPAGTAVSYLSVRATQTETSGWISEYTLQARNLPMLNAVPELYGAEGTDLWADAFRLDVNYTSTSPAGAAAGQYTLVSGGEGFDAESYLYVRVERL